MSRKRKMLLLTIFTIVISEDTLVFGTNINPVFIGIRFALYIFVLLFCFNNVWHYINKQAGISTLIIIGVVITTMFLNRDFRNGYFLQLLGVILAFKLVHIIEFEEFIESFSKIITFFSIVSIIFFILVFFVPPVLNKLPTISNYADNDFATIIVSNIMKGNDLFRNSSIFREPGVFGIYLIISLLYEFFYAPILNLRRILVFFIALVTTFSTMAFLAFGFIIIAYVFNSKNFTVKIYISVGTFLFLFLLYPLIYENIFSKFNTDAAEFRSTLSRISSVLVPGAIFQDHPLGVGLSNFVKLYPTYSSTLFNIELKPEGEATNTIINTFAIYGIVYGTLMIFAIWGSAKQYNRSRFVTLILFAIFIFLFSSQELRFSLLFNILIMYGLIYKREGSKLYS